jgi:hypothetical protein
MPLAARLFRHGRLKKKQGDKGAPEGAKSLFPCRHKKITICSYFIWKLLARRTRKRLNP